MYCGRCQSSNVVQVDAPQKPRHPKNHAVRKNTMQKAEHAKMHVYWFICNHKSLGNTEMSKIGTLNTAKNMM